MNLIKLAKKIATEAHKGQYRRDKKTPYITHPIAVADNIIGPYNRFESETFIICGYLHDVLEDTNLTREDLINKGIPKFSVDIVELLTKKEGQSYLEYLLKIKDDYHAKVIKIADINHNLITSKNNQKDKYLLALYVLNN